jgi:O-methyltransferase
MQMAKVALRSAARRAERLIQATHDRQLHAIYAKYRQNTMVPESWYVSNLQLSASAKQVDGCVVECGVWKGGMSAGIADILGPEREYFLFDSFEGLPQAQDIDGAELKQWQAEQCDSASARYLANCAASELEADAAMKMSSANSYKLIKGWFSDTIPSFRAPAPIAILRLDGDLYESTQVCLKYLYPQVAAGGLTIIDDYDTWRGCAQAVHEFLVQLGTAGAEERRLPRIRQHGGVFYLA